MNRKMKKLNEKKNNLVEQLDQAKVDKDIDKIEILTREIAEIDSDIKNIESDSDFKAKDSDGLVSTKNHSDSKSFANVFANGDMSKQSLQEVTMNVLTGAEASAILPSSIAGEIIYQAAQDSIFLNRYPIMPMNTQTVTIGKVKDAPTAEFKLPGKNGKETGLSIEGVTLDAKTVHAHIVLTEEQIQDISNLESIVRNSLAQSIAEVIDNKFMYGTGTGAEPKGLWNYEELVKVEYETKLDYPIIAQAKKKIRAKNGQINVIGLNPSTKIDLEFTTNSVGDFITPPSSLSSVEIFDSNGINESNAFASSIDSIIIGIRQGLTIKRQEVLTNGTVILKVSMRVDLALTRPEHIVKIDKKRDM